MEPERNIITMSDTLTTIPILTTGYVSVPVNTNEWNHSKNEIIHLFDCKIMKNQLLMQIISKHLTLF